MFKLVQKHINSEDLTLTNREFVKLASKGEIKYPENWKPVLVIFNIIKINL